MKIVKIDSSCFDTVKRITIQTINSIYPHYYPQGAVDFFCNHHNDKNILSDIESGRVYIIFDDDNRALGTITIKGCEICRLFVLPQYQGKGYGSKLISFAEQKIAQSYTRIILHASLPAKEIYLKRGYVISECHSIKTESGDYLCFDAMIKELL